MDVIITDSEAERRSKADAEMDLPIKSLGKNKYINFKSF